MKLWQRQDALLWGLSFLTLFLLIHAVLDWSMLATVDSGRTFFRFNDAMGDIGELQSENAVTLNWWITSVAYLLWLVPISGLLALTLSDRPRKSTFKLGVTTHFIIALIFGALLLGINIFYTINLLLANKAPADNLSGRNYANDERYCCVPAYAATDSDCPNHDPLTACANPLLISDLRISTPFLLRYIGYWVLFILHVVVAVLAYLLRGSIVNDADDNEKMEPLLTEAAYVPIVHSRRRLVRRTHGGN